LSSSKRAHWRRTRNKSPRVPDKNQRCSRPESEAREQNRPRQNQNRPDQNRPDPYPDPDRNPELLDRQFWEDASLFSSALRALLALNSPHIPAALWSRPVGHTRRHTYTHTHTHTHTHTTHTLAQPEPADREPSSDQIFTVHSCSCESAGYLCLQGGGVESNAVGLRDCSGPRNATLARSSVGEPVVTFYCPYF